MTVDFSSIRNHHEQAVFDAVLQGAARYPALQGDSELLADVACVALNRLPPRYIRHSVDLSFYQGERERLASDQALRDAVEYAFGFVQARSVLGART